MTTYTYAFSVTNASNQLILYYRFELKAWDKPNPSVVQNHIETILYNGDIRMAGEKPFTKELVEIIKL